MLYKLSNFPTNLFAIRRIKPLAIELLVELTFSISRNLGIFHQNISIHA